MKQYVLMVLGAIVIIGCAKPATAPTGQEAKFQSAIGQCQQEFGQICEEKCVGLKETGTSDAIENCQAACRSQLHHCYVAATDSVE